MLLELDSGEAAVYIKKDVTYYVVLKEEKVLKSDSYIAKNPAARRAPLANEVANKIVDFIQQAKIEPGTRIPSEFELAEKFEVGRGTVREAVKLLVSRNVLEIRPAKGTYVSENPGVTKDPLGLEFVPDKVKMVKDLLELRIVLECYAARNAANNASREQIETMKELVDSIDENMDDNELCTKYDMELHRCLAESSGNSVISIVLPVIRSNMQQFNDMSFERQWDVVNNGHRSIVNAIEQHNPMLAEAETVKHLSYVSEKISGMDK